MAKNIVAPFFSGHGAERRNDICVALRCGASWQQRTTLAVRFVVLCYGIFYAMFNKLRKSLFCVTLHSVTYCWKSGLKNIFAFWPTGFGKSALYMILSLLMDEVEWSW